jgi:hypothetical protein
MKASPAYFTTALAIGRAIGQTKLRTLLLNRRPSTSGIAA